MYFPEKINDLCTSRQDSVQNQLFRKEQCIIVRYRSKYVTPTANYVEDK
jgi:hypothetical protein